MCQVTSMSRTFSTSRIQREVIQANGQAGSNQKSAFVCHTCRNPGVRARSFPGVPDRGVPCRIGRSLT